ncbi:NAC domain-containing protein 104-like [Mangifera indica]|uniref:NAC domain-containing protein 104-like n=1 Tax=Mangifera indica TaxID=29780 RepID=UPI001CFAE920|nr:NAC domain-containing protein 104-like [Mangifera indica]
MCDGSVNLPPGFRFLPTDEELILHFLYRKASLLPCHPNIIPDLVPFFHDPWQLNGKALCSGNQWYFFSQVMEKRVSENGYWKDLNFELPIFSSAGKKIGVKKHFSFFTGEAPSGVEIGWNLQEYHLCNFAFNYSSFKRKRNRKLDFCKWVLCRVYERKNNSESLCYGDDDDNGTELSCLDEMFLSLEDDLADISLPN